MPYEFQSLYLNFITEHPGSSVTEQKVNTKEEERKEEKGSLYNMITKEL